MILDLDLGVSVNVAVTPGSGLPVVFMHGWGASSAAFLPAFERFASEGRTCIAPDLPPFGASGMPPIDWSLSDYTSMMLSLLDRLGVERAAFVGHSFGGRIAVDIASRTNRAERLVLVDAAGLRPRKGSIKRLRALRFRISRRLGLDTEKFYSADWRALPERMRGVFARVVAQDLSDRLSSIACPTLIVWGRHDRETPPYMAKRFLRGIKNSRLVMLDGGHFAYAERSMEFVAVLGDFLGRAWKQR